MDPRKGERAAAWSGIIARIGGGTATGTAAGVGTTAGVGTAAKAVGVSALVKASAMVTVGAVAAVAIGLSGPTGGPRRGPEGAAGPRPTTTVVQPTSSPLATKPSDPPASTPLLSLESTPDAPQPASSLAPAPRRPTPTPGSTPTLALRDTSLSQPTVGPAATPPLPLLGMTAGAATPQSAPPESAVRAEGALLLRARAALRDGQCAGALGTLEEATARFPRGALPQERAALSVEALACSGLEDEAARRAAAFLRDFPASPYADGIRRFIR